MSKKFDPYFEWLKIPPSEQPPNYYRLLSTARFESDPDVIDAAVNRLVGKLQNLSHGSRVDDAQRLLNDVAKARLCLTDPKRKSEYDRRLRQKLNQAKQKAVRQSAPTKQNTDKGKSGISPKRATPKTKHKPTKVKSATGYLLGYGLAILAIAAATFFVLYQQFARPTENAVASSIESNLDPHQAEPFESNQPSPLTQVQSPDSTEDSLRADDTTSTESEFPETSTNETLEQHGSKDEANVDDSTKSNDQSVTDSTPDYDGDVSTVLRPEELERFESQIGEFVEFQGVVVMANESRSGKTRYLRFSQDWDDTAMIFMRTRDIGESLTLEELKTMSGKTVFVTGVIEREFGTKRLGIKVRAKDQIEIIEQ